jgi:hypothetical protein
MSTTAPENVDLSSAVVDAATWPELAVRPDGTTIAVVYESRSGSQFAVSRSFGA